MRPGLAKRSPMRRPARSANRPRGWWTAGWVVGSVAMAVMTRSCGTSVGPGTTEMMTMRAKKMYAMADEYPNR